MMSLWYTMINFLTKYMQIKLAMQLAGAEVMDHTFCDCPLSAEQSDPGFSFQMLQSPLSLHTF